MSLYVATEEMGPNPREQIKEKSFKIASGMKKCGRLVHNTICLNFSSVMLLQKCDLFDVDRGWFLCIANALQVGDDCVSKWVAALGLVEPYG